MNGPRWVSLFCWGVLMTFWLALIFGWEQPSDAVCMVNLGFGVVLWSCNTWDTLLRRLSGWYLAGDLVGLVGTCLWLGAFLGELW